MLTTFNGTFRGFRTLEGQDGQPRCVALDLTADLQEVPKVLLLLHWWRPRRVPFQALIRAAEPGRMGGVRMKVLLEEFGGSPDMCYVTIVPVDLDYGPQLTAMQRLVLQQVQVECRDLDNFNTFGQV